MCWSGAPGGHYRPAIRAISGDVAHDVQVALKTASGEDGVVQQPGVGGDLRKDWVTRGDLRGAGGISGVGAALGQGGKDGHRSGRRR